MAPLRLILPVSATGRQLTVRAILASGSPHSLRVFHSLTRRLPVFNISSRTFSSTSPSLAWSPRHLSTSPKSAFELQKRGIFGGNTSRNLLAHLEQTANNNPQSASAQNAFYSALLRAGLPQLVTERYQSGKFASNAACDALYGRSLERMGQDDSADSHQIAGGLDPEQVQAVSRAVAARARNGNIAIPTGQGTGAKSSPLYVVVEESTSSMIFRWIKFFLYFGLVSYGCYTFLALVVDASGMLRRVGGSVKNEARPELQKTRFSDVHGCEEAKEDLQELVEFLKNPDTFSTLGGKLPKGVLLIGPPGTGKTLLARAVAGEAGVPFFYMSGSEFDEVYVGVGAKRVRELFGAARAKAPAIVFIDELDAIGGKRNDRDAAYVKQTLNQLLTELDGFDQNSGVIFLAATNFPKALDKALTRPGRFDRHIVVPIPDVRGRMAILKHHLRNIQLDAAVDAAIIARGTPGFSGADLENIVNQAAVYASKNKSKVVTMADLEWAKDKVMMGSERRSAVIQQKDKILTAYHEGGHALVTLFAAHADPLYKATIMPRGQALGLTYRLPDMDRVSMAKAEMEASIAIAMGGKVAEELVYGAQHVTSGASSDIQSATDVALHMVTRYGMSDLLGNVYLADDYDSLSVETKKQVEQEVRRMVEEGKNKAWEILTTHRKELDLLASALLEYETLSKDEIERVVRGESLPEKMRASVGVPIKLPEMIHGPFKQKDPTAEDRSDPGVTIPGTEKQA